ncbi:MAG: PilN domain-containing protein [Aquificae bacterium]|nr:PilN domain-containing protein [Aquificota bacterium]
MIRINLNTETKKKKKQKPPKDTLLLIIPMIPIVAGGVYLFYLNTLEKSLTEEKEILEREKNRYYQQQQEINRLKRYIISLQREKEEIQRKEKLMERLQKGRDRIIPTLKTVGLSIPDGVWLKEIDIKPNSGTLKGYSFDPKQVSTFYKGLKKHHTDVYLSSVKRQKTKREGVGSIYSFTIKVGNGDR